MSGRVRWKRDGKIITGFRKTDRRQAAGLPKHMMPDWRVTVPLPSSLAFAIAPSARSGVIGVTVKDTPSGVTLEATGKDCTWLFGQLAQFLGKVSNAWQGRLAMRAQRDGYEGLTSGAPQRPPVDRSNDVFLVLEPSLVIPRGHRDPLILPLK